MGGVCVIELTLDRRVCSKQGEGKVVEREDGEGASRSSQSRA